jgi:hypothetical protein
VSLPVEWRVAEHSKEPVAGGINRAAKAMTDMLEVEVKRQSENYSAKPASFDPYEKRNEFFRLKVGDLHGLLRFLNTVGLFESAGDAERPWKPISSVIVRVDENNQFSVNYVNRIHAEHIWQLRRMVQFCMEKQIEIADETDFQVRLVRVKEQPRMVLTTTTFMDAVFLASAIDRTTEARVQKCAREDCAIMFTTSSGHEKKYCERYCAHIESVRRDRERKKNRKRANNSLRGRA